MLRPSILYGFFMKPALQSGARFAELICQKCSERDNYIYIYIQHFEVPIGLLSLQSRAHFADPIFQKCLERDIFFTF